MRYNFFKTSPLLIAAAFLIGTIGSPLTSAKEQREHSDDHAISKSDQAGTTVTNMFLRTNAGGRALLYIAYPNRTLLVIDVTNPKEPRQIGELKLLQSSDEGAGREPDSKAQLSRDAEVWEQWFESR